MFIRGRLMNPIFHHRPLPPGLHKPEDD
jgi:hypothetical protein